MADIEVGRAEAFFGATGLLGVFVLVTWGVVAYRGLNPETMSGIYAGVFAGLISLVVEIAVIGRSLRLFAHNGMGATLQTFTMRLVIVGALGIWFMRGASATDAQAFCLSYCGTFFVYLCWLTWRTYKAPVQYQGKRAAPAAAAAARAAASRGVLEGVR